MKFRKLLSLSLAVGMITAQGAALTAFADDTQAPGDLLIAEQPSAIPARVTLNGTFISAEEGRILINTENGEFIINTNEESQIMNTETAPIDIATVKEGAEVSVFANSATALSLPPQTFGHIVMVKESEEAPAAPLFIDVATAGADEDGNYEVMSTDGMYLIRISEETQVLPFRTRNIVRKEDITEGSTILVYADIMTMSIPAQVPANKVYLMPKDIDNTENNDGLQTLDETSRTTPVADMTKIIVGDKKIEAKLQTAETAEGQQVVMVPLRVVAETLGYEVAWNDMLQSVTVGTVPMGVNFKVGEDSYNKARMAPTSLGIAPILVATGDADIHVTYVPVTFFSELLEAEVTTDGATIVIK